MTAIDWDRLDDLKFADENGVIVELLGRHGLAPQDRAEVVAHASTLVEAVRAAPRRPGLIDGFLREYSLGSQEGIALMCLAEALLRTPDAETRDRLIAERIGAADWGAHIGRSESLFVNASTWALMLTGRLLSLDERAAGEWPALLRRLEGRIGAPAVRVAITAGIRILSEQFVLGKTIGDALARAGREDMLCSFDMLGEGARTAADAARYATLYAEAIERVGREGKSGASPERRHGVSVKLSALFPRYEAVQAERVQADLYPVLRELAIAAARHELNLAIDAEETDRLVLSLTLLDRLAREEALQGWQGLGIVVQAYQKRAPQVIAKVAELARQSGRRIMVRLVKGAYWDTEIKRAQVGGHADYPVFTTKAATDLCYLASARALIDAAPVLYPQFATHNAHTLAAVAHMAANRDVAFECQRLHGMGEALYKAAKEHGIDAPLRVYAPVGRHEDLLPYLVRRLLENGANSSFVHALYDEDIPAEELAADPIARVEAAPARNPRLPLPADLYGGARVNAPGRDLSRKAVRAVLTREVARARARDFSAGPIVGGAERTGDRHPVASPADPGQMLGRVIHAGPDDLNAAVARARAAQPRWDALGGPARAVILRRMADHLCERADGLTALLVLEAGKTLADAVGEVREAIDFCRYYATLAEQQFGDATLLPGPAGETNRWRLSGRGVFGCISPWNFPLSIFTGQVAAALAAGNAVIAKPAEQTPLVAAEAVRLFHAARLEPDLLALLPGEGATVGAAIVSHPGIDGVAFTGGTDTGTAINRALAARPGPVIPFIAETGGLNAMVVDTSALREQVIDDAIASAFGAAGQRCSALRILFVPREAADMLVEGLAGALAALVVGDPADPATDVGPMIDAGARAALDAHLVRLERDARIVSRARLDPASQGHFFAPTIAEILAPDFLEREIFGPVLHIYRYAPGELGGACRLLAARGYGLTLGIHSRIRRFASEVEAMLPAGNVYVNRSMVGAVVGVQPFGGIGLSGTGPKAGGPHALLRYAREHSLSVNIMAEGGDPSLFSL